MARVLSKKQKMEQMMIARITILSVAGGEMVTIYGVGKWRIVASVVAVKVVAMVVFFLWHGGIKVEVVWLSCRQSLLVVVVLLLCCFDITWSLL